MDIIRLLSDHGIPFISGGHKHSTEGWVNVHCPFCPGSRDFHLGISETGACHCWRCGTHSFRKTFSALLHIPEIMLAGVLKKYQISFTPLRKDYSSPKVSIFPFKFPEPHGPLTKLHQKYLIARGFDPEKIVQEWGIFGTGPVSFLDSISFSHRIIIPIYWEQKIVSFQSRDITDRSQVKYLACPKKREVIHHKNIIYASPKGFTSPTAIVVEGVFDVWRLGHAAVATFGIKYKMEQVLEIAKNFERIFILFDPEEQAQKQARSLLIKLRTLKKETYLEKITNAKDPGSMNQDDADHLVCELVGKKRGGNKK